MLIVWFMQKNEPNRLITLTKQQLIHTTEPIRTLKSIKIGLLPPHNFLKIWYANKRDFSKFSNINLISNFKQNLIEDFYQQNTCFNSNTCYFAKESIKPKTILQRKE